MTEGNGGTLPLMAGFVIVAGGMVWALGALLSEPPPSLPWDDAGAEAEVMEDPAVALREKGDRLYVPLTKFLDVGLGRGKPVLQASATVAVRGSAEELLALNTLVGANLTQIEAAMMAEALDLMGTTPDIVSIHRDLPGRLRDAINRVIGTEEWPDPVEEVMLTSVALQMP